jgi:serine protease Do
MKTQSTKSLRPWLIGAVTGISALVVTTCLAFDLGSKSGGHPADVKVDNTPLKHEVKAATSFASVAKRAAPCVVNVFTTKTIKNSMHYIQPFWNDPLFQQFFGGQPHQGYRQEQPQTFKEQSLGSGVIVSKDGYILTNNHVVDGADEIKVTFAKNDKEFPAKVVGTDKMTDIAVLKIDTDDLHPITFGDSDKIEVGDGVLAIGNPFGVGQTVTSGIISAVGRGGLSIEDYEDFIQTDAAINPGNSGGALVDMEGRLIGINTAILSRSGGNQGIGFAIPVNLARNVMQRLIEHGKVERGFLGVQPQDLTPDLAEQFNVPKDQQGALLSQIIKHGAAEKAGLKSGDVIIEFDGKPVKDARDLQLKVGQTNPGADATVKILRNGKVMTFDVKLKQRPEQTLAKNGNQQDNSSSDTLKGVVVDDIDQASRNRLNLPQDLRGALIVSVDPNSASADAGLRPGDVILQIQHHDVHNAEEAVEASKEVKGKHVLLLVYSHGGSRWVLVNEDK